MAAPPSLKEDLLNQGIRLRDYSAGNRKVVCPKCSSTRKHRTDPCLSVTVQDDGSAVWKCHNCSWAGGVRGDARAWAEPRKPKIYKKPEVPAAPTQPQRMLAWFERRGISADTVREFGVFVTTHWFHKIERQSPCIAFPYRVNGEVLNIKYRIDHNDPETGPTKDMQQAADAQPCLFNADSIADDEVIWAEGETDTMSLWEAGFRSIVTLPNGADETPRYNPGDRRFDPLAFHADRLLKVKKFLIASDADQPGEALAQELAWRFGADRCWRVRWPEGCKDANAVLMKHGADALRAAVAAAEQWPIEGLVQPATLRDEILAIYRGEVAQPVSTGFASLDPFWRIMPRSFNLVTGIPNHGKSSFVDQIAVTTGLRLGWRFAVFSPEHPPARHLIRLIEKRAAEPFYDGPTPRMTETSLGLALDWVNEHFVLIQSTDAGPTIDWILERARAAAMRHGINALIIDPYNEIETTRDRNQTETEFISELIRKIKLFCAAHNVVAFMVAHPTKLPRDRNGQLQPPSLYDIAGSANWSNKADAAIVVHRDFGEDTTQVIVRKIREQPYFGKQGSITLKFDEQKRIFVDTGRASDQAGDEPSPRLAFGYGEDS